MYYRLIRKFCVPSPMKRKNPLTKKCNAINFSRIKGERKTYPMLSCSYC